MINQKNFESDLSDIDESKYLIRDILVNQKADDYTCQLFKDFHRELSTSLWSRGCLIHPRTHIRGVTYFANEKKAFIGLDVRQHFISLLFFTGDYEIPGLLKGNWLKGGDKNGCKMFRVTDDVKLEEAIKYAYKAYVVARAWPLPPE